jgi:2-methylisocitrate lyase-like PEP mutase family enzyme
MTMRSGNRQRTSVAARRVAGVPSDEEREMMKAVDDSGVTAKARLLRSLHELAPLVLPNVWDPASAVLTVAAGARAIATTSGGISWALGRPDGEGVSRDEMGAAVGRITSVVDVPVTADAESGYGRDPRAVAETVEALVRAGAAGANIEDSDPDHGSLFTVDEQAHRLRAAREAAAASGVPEFVVNARTDVFLRRVGDPARRLDAVIARANGYAEADADVLFVPGLLDLDILRTLVASSPLPVNAMAGPGGPTVAQLGEVGVRRVTVGTGIAQAAYTVARDAAQELLGMGTYSSLTGAIGYPELNRLFPTSG